MEEKDKKYQKQTNALLMIQVIGQTSVNFINKKKLTAELLSHIKAIKGDGTFSDELSGFAEFFVDSSLNSKAYGTAVFGTIPMSREGVKTRLLQDIEEITVKIPARFGLENESAPIREALLKAVELKTKL